MNIQAIAKVCHEVNRGYCIALGDLTQKAWEDAPDWQRASAIKGVEFAMANPDATPEESHESWLAEKRATGWKYGPIKNEVGRQHPCFLPYEQLPAAPRLKDSLFLTVVRALKDA